MGMSGPDGDIVADTIEAYSLEAAVPDRINTIIYADKYYIVLK